MVERDPDARLAPTLHPEVSSRIAFTKKHTICGTCQKTVHWLGLGVPNRDMVQWRPESLRTCLANALWAARDSWRARTAQCSFAGHPNAICDKNRCLRAASARMLQRSGKRRHENTGVYNRSLSAASLLLHVSSSFTLLLASLHSIRDMLSASGDVVDYRSVS